MKEEDKGATSRTAFSPLGESKGLWRTSNLILPIASSDRSAAIHIARLISAEETLQSARKSFSRPNQAGPSVAEKRSP